MARVHILCSSRPIPFDPFDHCCAFLLKLSAELDDNTRHQLTEDPQDADIILFAESGRCGRFAERVRAHPVYRKFSEKSFLFDQADGHFPVLPGLYTGLTEELYQPDHTRTGFYLLLAEENPLIAHRPLTGSERYLTSFIGSRTAPVRNQIFAIQRPDILLHDTSDRANRIRYTGEPHERLAFWTYYADAMADSEFVLCPRGVSPNTIRLFEAMKMGRACVILSDEWHKIDGVDWDSFSIAVPEQDVDKIPQILEREAHRARKMGDCARREWERCFSEKSRFHWVVEQCLDIRERRQLRGPLHHWYRHVQHLLAPRNWRKSLNSKAVLYRLQGKIYWH
jgi:Exostosin family